MVAHRYLGHCLTDRWVPEMCKQGCIILVHLDPCEFHRIILVGVQGMREHPRLHVLHRFVNVLAPGKKLVQAAFLALHGGCQDERSGRWPGRWFRLSRTCIVVRTLRQWRCALAGLNSEQPQGIFWGQESPRVWGAWYTNVMIYGSRGLDPRAYVCTIRPAQRETNAHRRRLW